MKHKLKYNILLVIFLIALAGSIIISFVPLPIICTQFEGCNTVLTSSYAKTLGIDNSFIGIIIFSAMSVLIYSHIRKPRKNKELMINLYIFFGAMVALYFLYLQQFVLHAYCKYCLVIDLGMLISFGITNIPLSDKKENELRKQKNV